MTLIEEMVLISTMSKSLDGLSNYELNDSRCRLIAYMEFFEEPSNWVNRRHLDFCAKTAQERRRKTLR